MTALLSPFAVLLAALLALLLGVALRWRWLRWAAIAGVLLALLGTTPLVGNALVGAIESQADAAADAGACAAPEAVVLLSGGLWRPPRDLEDFAALSSRTLERVSALLARDGWRELPLVVAGGGRFDTSESSVIGALLRRYDVDPRRVMLEQRSKDTWTNATEVRALRPELRRIALATGALHLPRARIAFQAAGFEVCPWPLHREALAVDGLGALWPGGWGLRKTELALHEWVGGYYYRWRARRAASVIASS